MKSKSISTKNKLSTNGEKLSGSFYNNFRESIFNLIKETSTNLPPDVRNALKLALQNEQKDTCALLALQMIGINANLACDKISPICQDTGMPTFEVKLPINFNHNLLKKEIENAIADATKNGILRPNAVDSLTSKNSGNNLGIGIPVIHFEQWDEDFIEVKLILKGGGCENKNIQYSLPCDIPHLGRADRNLDGVKKCLMHAIWQAQGEGCSIGAIGASIGGDRTTGYEHAKKQLFRLLDDTNPNPELAKLEEDVLVNANKLGIGTMGFGGSKTLMGCKIGYQHRLPASFFVSVAYNCWAFRRLGILINSKNGKTNQWLYKNKLPVIKISEEQNLPLTGKEISLTLPLTEGKVKQLKVGDVVLLNGIIYTGRDMLHHYLLTNNAPVNLNGGAIYHCGPVALKQKSKWMIKAAGPTTSIREEPYQNIIIQKFNIRAVIGKGGMGANTLNALKEYGCVYLNAIGGAAQYYASCIESVDGVDFLEFGIPEAMWHLRVKNFPAIVTMDSHGNSLHENILQSSASKLSQIK